MALAAIASNTGCTSEGELAITFRISAVAVCRSSASCVSFIETAAFFDRDLRLAREGLRKRNLPLGERPHLIAGEGENAHDLPVIMQRRHETGAGSLGVDAGDDQRNPFLIGPRRLEILDVKERSIQGAASHQIEQRHGLWQRSRLDATQTGEPRDSVLGEPEGAIGRVA